MKKVIKKIVFSLILFVCSHSSLFSMDDNSSVSDPETKKRMYNEIHDIISQSQLSDTLDLREYMKNYSRNMISIDQSNLSRIANFHSLRHLYLPNYEPTDDRKLFANGVNIIANGCLSLETLDLQSQKIGDQGVEFIANSRFAPSLKSLNLSANLITGKGVISIATKIVNLTFLDLSHNDLKNEAGHLAHGKLQHLEELNLAWVFIGEEGLKDIMNSENLSKLKYINLSANKFEDCGVEAIIGGKLFSNLKKLILEWNWITEKGVEKMQQAVIDKNNSLELSWGEPY